MPHLVASISAHGFGHMAITAPVLERLHEAVPQCRVTVSSNIPEAVLRNRIKRPLDMVTDPQDFGLRMHRDLSVDTAATVADYAAIHGDWQANIEGRAAWLAESACDLLLSNISYMNIAAAHHAGIPAVALCPLNWADLYRYFAPDTPACRGVIEQMTTAYNRASVFLAPRPCMPMPNFDTVEIIPPIAQVGRDQRTWLRKLYGLASTTRLVLLALGGQEADFEARHLPQLENVRWLVEARWNLRRDDIMTLDHSGLAFPDLLASCDLLVAKPGYGAFVEAACLGKPVAYLRRPHWPEESFLIDWLQQHVACREVPRGDTAALAAAVRALMGAPPRQACAPDGIEATVRHVCARLPR